MRHLMHILITVMCILCSATACWFAADEISASIANFLQINAEYVYTLVATCALLSILKQSDTRPNDSLTYMIDPVLIRCCCVLGLLRRGTFHRVYVLEWATVRALFLTYVCLIPFPI